MGDFFKGLLDKAPDIIGKASESPLGVAALIVLVLGVVVVLLFREAAGKLKVLALVMITGGFLGIMALVFVPASNPKPPLSRQPGESSPDKTALAPQPGESSPEQTAIQPPPGESSPEKTAPGNQADTKLDDATRLYKAGQYDQARAAYGEALTLFTQEGNRQGQALALNKLGDLESTLGRNDQAHAAYGEALTLSKQEGDRQGQALALWGLGDLDSRKNPQQAARYFEEAAKLFGMTGDTYMRDAALRKADKLYK